MEAIMRSFAGAILVIMALQSGALAQSPPEPAPPGTAVPPRFLEVRNQSPHDKFACTRLSCTTASKGK